MLAKVKSEVVGFDCVLGIMVDQSNFNHDSVGKGLSSVI